MCPTTLHEHARHGTPPVGGSAVVPPTVGVSARRRAQTI
jgi:hypothetical protein